MKSPPVEHHTAIHRSQMCKVHRDNTVAQIAGRPGTSWPKNQIPLHLKRVQHVILYAQLQVCGWVWLPELPSLNTNPSIEKAGNKCHLNPLGVLRQNCHHLHPFGGAFPSILSQFSTGCAGKVRSPLWPANSNWYPCCTGNGHWKQRDFHCDITHLQCNLHQMFKGRTMWNHQEFLWKDSQLCNSSATLRFPVQH